MKRYIKSAQKARVPEKQNVYDVLEFMDWRTPTFCDKGKHGYICKWGGRSMVDHRCFDMADKKTKEEFGDDVTEWNDEAWDARRQYIQAFRPEAKKLVESYIEEIYQGLGIKCQLTPTGNIMIPFAEV